MAEVHWVGLKNLRANFRVEELFWARMFPVIFRCRKTLVVSTRNHIILCNYFEHLLVYLYDLDAFLYVSGIRMNTLLNLLQLDF